MARRLDRIFGSRSGEDRSTPAELSWGDYIAQVFAYAGNQYTLPGAQIEDTPATFMAQVQQIGRTHGIVAAAVAARAAVLSQIEFAWRDNSPEADTTGQLVDGPGLSTLNRPPLMTRQALLTLAESHVSYAGISYFTRRDGFRLLRPDLVDALIEGPETAEQVRDGEGELVGYAYFRRGRDNTPDTYTVDEVAAWVPEPDPIFWWRGQSWVTGIVRDVQLDRQMSHYVENFLENSATPNIIIKPDARLSVDQVKEFRKEYDRKQIGSGAAGRTLWLGGGSDIEVVGSTIDKLSVRELQGGAETRVSVRSGVPAPLLGIREGMQGSSLNAGNYGQTRRLWADRHLAPHADSLCATLERLFRWQPSKELTYNPDRVLLLQEDRKDAAEILSTQATAINTLVAAGFTPESAERAIRTGNTAVLDHTGLTSVQLLPPGTTGEPSAPTQGNDDE